MLTNRRILFILIGSFFFCCAVATDPVFSDYKMKAYVFEGHQAKIVFPKKKHPNNYWIWRARFWGSEPQVDKALLEKGFHLVYIDVANLFGNDKAVNLWNKFYDHCVQTYGLNKKVVLEGFSRGGLMVYNWAAVNTDKVFSIYADAPVCDIKSWPGGLFNGEGNPNAWELCLKAYNLDTISVKNFKHIPLNNCVAVARAGIPVIHVYGDADRVVPFEENTQLLAERFEQENGIIKLIRKEGVGHHPHSLKDPEPIVNFILESVSYTKY